MAGVTRFYDTFQPEHYDIYLDINRAKKTIVGTSTIKGTALTKQVSVHEKYMDIKSVKADGKEVDFTVNDQEDQIAIEVGKTGEITLAIDFAAPLTDTMMGIYPSYYQVDGVKKEIIGTQFETTAARQAFPCIDEPAAKATFSLAIKFDEQPGETILANMPEDHVEDGVHYFEPTVRMSSYLVAFAFGDLQKKLTETKSGVKIGVFATKAHQAKELDFALDIAKRAIEFYEDFYQTKYPLPHSWQLALPDFSAGAMENWGLVTYREAYLTLDPDNASLRTKQIVATVITHELAHQWFGDLVTMNWWDDLWLNESFANMMEYLSVDALEPNWQIWQLFQTLDAPAALQRDATDGVQPVHVQVNNPAEIDSLFDSAIVYAKGSRLLVMVRALLGDGALRKGLKYYFDHHKFHNAKGNDLWDALSTATDLNIGEIMHTWLDQPGYPVVNAFVENGHLKLTQKQFFIGGGEDKNRLWQIPLQANFKAPKIMKEASLDLGDYQELRQAAGEPLRLNIGNTSHFIIKYDQTLLDDILKNADLDAIAQLQLLQDLRLLADGQQASYAELLPLMQKFADSKYNIVNHAVYQIAKKLQMFAGDNDNDLKKFYDQLSANQIKRLGFEPKAGEDNDDQLTRPIVAAAAEYAGNPETVAALHKLYQVHEDDLLSLSADVRYIVLRNEMKHFGSKELLDKWLKLYVATPDANLKDDLCASATAAEDPAILQAIVAEYENAQVIKPQDLRAWFAYVLNNKHGQQMAWDWLRKEWEWLDKTVGGDMEFVTYITVTSRAFHTPERLAEFKAFFDPMVDVPGLGREIKMDEKTIEAKVELIKAEGKEVNAAIADAVK
ncbi:MAG: M1 family metallopeptidase [Lactobacillus sp.]|jgi:aminopeptidase N|nr:M1 family metallopeptidase [Lactobacillus sp.]MCH3906081.1 M1 family metallopeptidase [Lactobacillus sp.]MCH3990344.1 M1 family metallopeptidase [Lactobacillus sp.]MCH4068941.1 M1 family metallopeptidase [Lactobacillus sp.]MCI1303343.1 M1 family metallopeptidase [Lactobacillus sp.]